jgi:hypothetical protein
MKSIIILLLFAGMFMIVHGIYEQKLKDAMKNKQIEYRFVPRSLYEEQLGDPDVSRKFASMFDTSTPWDQAKTDAPPNLG